MKHFIFLQCSSTYFHISAQMTEEQYLRQKHDVVAKKTA